MTARVETLPPIKLFVRSGEGGTVTNVWVERVPLDFTDADVAHTFELAAERGDAIAKKALPFMRVRMNLHGDDIGLRVYLDND